MKWSIEEKRKLMEALTILSEIYNRSLSKLALKFYVDILEEYPFEFVIQALNAYVKNASGKASFFPKPGDIISLIEGNPDDKANYAWAKVVEALEKIGTYESVRFRDPIINACIWQLGGWVKLGKSDYKTLEFIGNEFRKLYQQLYQYFIRTGKKPEIDYLPGVIETQNNAMGFKDFIPMPVDVEVGSEFYLSASQPNPKKNSGKIKEIQRKSLCSKTF